MAVVDHPHRLAGLARQERRVQGDHRRVLLLAAEAAARLGLDHHRLGVGQLQGSLQGAVDVVRALARAVHRDPAIGVRDGDHRLVLDVQLLLVANAVGPLDHQLRLREADLQVAASHLDMRELLARFERVEGRRQALGPDAEVAPGRTQRPAVGRGNQAQRLGLVADLAADRDQDRLVVPDQAHHVVAGDVGCGDDHHLAPVERLVEVYAQERGMGFRRSDGGAVPGAGEDEVVGVLGKSGELGRPFAPQRTAPRDATGRRAAGRHNQRVGRADHSGAGGQNARHADRSSWTDDSTDAASTGQPRPRRSARPGSAPVCSPSSTTSSPLTATYSIPSGNWRGWS